MPKEMIQLLKDLHLMDIVLFGTIIGFALFGFTRGMVKVGIILGSIYIGFVVGAIYYVPFAGVIADVLHVSLSRVAEIIAFLMLNALVSGLLILLMYQFFGHLEVSGRAGACIDRPVGMILGFVTGIVLTSIVVVLLEVPHDVHEDVRLAGDQAPYLEVFDDWYQSSIIAPRLKDGLPYLMASITPLVGGKLPSLLVVQPGQTGLVPTLIGGLYTPGQ
ncbi:MAG TPA: CvpA family protein [Chloroflexia bacterium]|nr:CvpA family protein [Chloroflexia bacterium]